jgi:hypothetical protein
MVAVVVEFMLDAPAFAVSGGWDFHFDSNLAVCEGGGVHTIARLSSHHALAGRAFLQIFITTTLTYRLRAGWAFRFARCWLRFAEWSKPFRVDHPCVWFALQANRKPLGSDQNSGRSTLRSAFHNNEILL